MAEIKPHHSEEEIRDFGSGLLSFIDQVLEYGEYDGDNPFELRHKRRLGDLHADLSATDATGQTDRAKKAIRAMDGSDAIRPYDLARVDPDVQKARGEARQALGDIVFALGDAVSTYIAVRDEFYKTFEDVMHRVSKEIVTIDDFPPNS